MCHVMHSFATSGDFLKVPEGVTQSTWPSSAILLFPEPQGCIWKPSCDFVLLFINFRIYSLRFTWSDES